MILGELVMVQRSTVRLRPYLCRHLSTRLEFGRVTANDSAVEIDMFRVRPRSNWPEDFWISELERFVAGGGCDVVPPENHCPEGFTGPNEHGCCVTGWAADCDMDCAKSHCESYQDWAWQDLDFAHNPFTCCPGTASPTVLHV